MQSRVSASAVSHLSAMAVLRTKSTDSAASANTVLVPVLPFLITDTGSSATAYGLLQSTFWMTETVLAPLLAALSDYIGRKFVIALSLLISAVAMPASFVAEVVLFNALGRVARPGGGRASRVTLKLPLAQIAATMLVLVLTAAGGLVAQNKCVEARRERTKVWIKRALKIVIPVCVASFIMADSLLSATYYGGDNAWRFWLAAVLVHLAPLPLSAAAAWRERPVTRDAIILTVIRRNPVIMFGVAALSFRDAPGVDFNRAFGIVAAAATTLDWVSLPLFLGMRYARYGKVCVAVKKDADEKGEEADEEAGAREGEEEIAAESKQPVDDATDGAAAVEVDALCEQSDVMASGSGSGSGEI